MARQNINIGSAANDGTGDTLRTTGRKINENFVEIYQILGGDSNIAYSNVRLGNNTLTFEGVAEDAYETTITAIEPVADAQITIPNTSGQFILDSATQTLTNKTLVDPLLKHPDIGDSAGGTSYTYAFRPNKGLAANRNLTLPLITVDDHLISRTSTDTLTNKRLFNARLSGKDVRIDSDINDATGNPVIRIATSASSVNYIQFEGAATSNDPIIQTTGTDTNIDLRLAGKGTGSVRLLSATQHASTNHSSTGSEIDLNDDVSYFTASSGTQKHVLPRGTDRSGHIHTFANVGGAIAIVIVDSDGSGNSYLGSSGGTYGRFRIQPYQSIQAVYSSAGDEGWYLIGLDSDGGLGSNIVLGTKATMP